MKDIVTEHVAENQDCVVFSHQISSNSDADHDQLIADHFPSKMDQTLPFAPFVKSNGWQKPLKHVEPAPTKQFLDGPDQVVPAVGLRTTAADGKVKLQLEETGMASLPPISVPGLLHKIASQSPDVVAMANKNSDGSWTKTTYKEYEVLVRTCAKAFLKLGLQRHHSVCILGFNSPEWFVSDLGAICAGGIAVGVYTTNSADACRHCAHESRANIIVVEDQKQLEKILQVRNKLPHLKAIVQYSGIPHEEGVLSWGQLMQIGRQETDEVLEKVMKTIAVNECCTLVFTSGTVGNPKAVMLSHDNLTWSAEATGDAISLAYAVESVISYLPLSHIAAQSTDIYCTMARAQVTNFADRDALKGSLLQSLHEVRPTRFLGVPRVWEKIYEKMNQLGSQTHGLKKMIATWAKAHGFQHNMDQMMGMKTNTWSYTVANAFIFSKIRRALGLDRCVGMLSGAAPLSAEIKKYFMSLDLPVKDVYGMSETAGAHTISNRDAWRLESTGRTIPGMYTKIFNQDEFRQGEILMKGRHIFMGYLNDEAKTLEALDDGGWLHSGDIGEIDEDGFLYITGRIKEIIITAGGENVAPTIIEDSIKAELPIVSNAILIGDKMKYLSLLVTVKTEMNQETGQALDELSPVVKTWTKSLGFECSLLSELLAKHELKVREAIQQGINKTNTKAISNAQRVQKFAILRRDFSLPTGELGPTLKLKRNVVVDKFADIISTLYQ